MEIVRKLMLHMDKAEGTMYRDELLSKIILICSQNNYQFITNFEWYITVLLELSQMEFGAKQGNVIAMQFLDVCIRVQAIRKFAVNEMHLLLEQYISHHLNSTMQEVLYAVAFLCGEFASMLENPEITLKSMLVYKNLPHHIQSVFIHNTLKLFSFLLTKYEEKEQYDEILELAEAVHTQMYECIRSAELEVQERATTSLVIIESIQEEILNRKQEASNRLMDEMVPNSVHPSIAESIAVLFAGELNPVAPKAQKKVPIPEGLDLDAWINEPSPPPSDSESENETENIFVPKHSKVETKFYNEKPTYEPTPEELEKIREARKLEQMNNPHYLKGTTDKKKEQNNVDNIPIEELNLSVPLKITQKRSDRYLNLDGKKKQKKRSRKSRKGRPASGSSSENEADSMPVVVVNRDLELPEGAVLSDSASSHGQPDDPHRALDIDLDSPPPPTEIKKPEEKKAEKVKKVKKLKKKTEKNEVNLLGEDITLYDDEEKAEKKHKKVKKEKKKSKEEHKKKHKKHVPAGYEEATGISTPRKEFQ